MRTSDPLLLLLVLLTTVPSVEPFSSASAHKGANPSCSAPIRTQLDPAPLSSHDQDLLKLLLPQPTSDQPAVRGELRAPLHIPCQLATFPHLQVFVDEIQRHQLSGFEIKEYAQPPHLIFFDENQQVVETIVVEPTWTGFELRDLIQESILVRSGST
ncbi:Sep15/SelM redox domain, partial [Phytophthora infestans]